jgi:hypothetical protein
VQRRVSVLFSTNAACANPCAVPKDDFAHPPARSRPSFRYWLPDASVNSSIVAANINSAASIGAGGIEFIGFYQYGL